MEILCFGGDCQRLRGRAESEWGQGTYCWASRKIPSKFPCRVWLKRRFRVDFSLGHEIGVNCSQVQTGQRSRNEGTILRQRLDQFRASIDSCLQQKVINGRLRSEGLVPAGLVQVCSKHTTCVVVVLWCQKELQAVAVLRKRSFGKASKTSQQ